MTTQTSVLTFDSNCNPSVTDLTDLWVPASNDLAASALAYAMAQNDADSINGRVGAFYLVDDFDSDNLSTTTNARYVSSGGYYDNRPLTTFTPSVAGDYVGETAATTFGSGSVTWGASDDNLRSNSVTFTGDFELQAEVNDLGDAWCFGVYDTSEDATFSGTDSSGRAGMQNMTDSWYVRQPTSSSTCNIIYGNSSQATFAVAEDDRLRISRSGSEIKLYVNDTEIHSYSQTSSATLRPAMGQGNQRGDLTNMTWSNIADASNMTLAPTAVTLDTASPECIHAYVVIDPQESLTVGTDIVMTASIDGGTTDATGTWTKVGEIGGDGETLYRVAFDVSAQTGSSLIWELTTANNKEVRVNDIVGLVPLY